MEKVTKSRKAGHAVIGSPSRRASLFQRLEENLASFTPSERTIANYLLENRTMIAFESAASLADKLRISAVTVGRFCRRIGYRHFKELKADLKVDAAGIPWPVGDALRSFVSSGPDEAQLQQALRQEVAALVEAYKLVGTPMWNDVARRLAQSDVLHVVGFQTERGLAAQFAHLLQYVRRDVRLADTSAGNFAEILADGRPNRCLVMFETRRYSQQALALAEAASDQGITVVIITDKYCDWARRFTPYVFAMSTDTGLFWNSMVALVAVTTLLGNSVVAELGTTVEERLSKHSDLYATFTGHVSPRRRKRQPTES